MYRHRYKDSLGKRKEKKKSGFKTEKTALKSLLDVKAAILNDGSNYVEKDNITVSQWVDTWYDTQSHSLEVSSLEQRKRVIDQQIKPLIGKHKLSKLDRATYIREYINKLHEKFQTSTVQLHHRIFNIAINAAVDDEIIPRNRFTNIPFEKSERLENFLTPGELNVFIATAKRYLNITRYTIVLLLAYSGIRHGELLGLKWGNINFEDNTLTVNATRDHHGYRKPKTANSYRTIRIDEVLIKQLLKYQKWCIATKMEYGMQLDKEKDFVFITEDNEPCSQEVLRLTFNNVYRKLKADDVKIKRITPHGMRHTHATSLINNGIPPRTVADRLGNSVEMVYTIYAHSFKEMEDKAVSVFGEIIQAGAKFGAK